MSSLFWVVAMESSFPSCRHVRKSVKKCWIIINQKDLWCMHASFSSLRLAESLETRRTTSGRLSLFLALRDLLLLFSRMNRGGHFRKAGISQRFEQAWEKSTIGLIYVCIYIHRLTTRRADAGLAASFSTQPPPAFLDFSFSPL